MLPWADICGPTRGQQDGHGCIVQQIQRWLMNPIRCAHAIVHTPPAAGRRVLLPSHLLERRVRKRLQNVRIHKLGELGRLSTNRCSAQPPTTHSQCIAYLGDRLRPALQLPCLFPRLLASLQVTAETIERRTPGPGDNTHGYCHMWYTWCRRPTCENQAPTGATNCRRASMPLRLGTHGCVSICTPTPTHGAARSPGVFPLEQRAGLQLVLSQLKDAALRVRRRGRQHGELLAQLRLARVEVRDHLAVRFHVLRGSPTSTAATSWHSGGMTYVRVAAQLGDRLVVSAIVLILEDVDCRVAAVSVRAERGLASGGVQNVSWAPTTTSQLPVSLTCSSGSSLIVA